MQPESAERDQQERRAVQRMKAGDIGGLGVMVEQYQIRAVRAAYLITRDRAQAEDIVQAAFVRAFQRIRTFDIERPFGPWFLRSVVNDALKAVTRNRQISLEAVETNGKLPLGDVLAAPEPAPLDAALEAETRTAVWEALGELPPEQRAVVVLRYYLELSEGEMADALHIPKGTVKWRLHAARERLRGLLRAFSPEPAFPQPVTPTEEQE
jgi:RNA polymerase sigma-70 factor, ECF subfamily